LGFLTGSPATPHEGKIKKHWAVCSAFRESHSIKEVEEANKKLHGWAFPRHYEEKEENGKPESWWPFAQVNRKKIRDSRRKKEKVGNSKGWRAGKPYLQGTRKTKKTLVSDLSE